MAFEADRDLPIVGFDGASGMFEFLDREAGAQDVAVNNARITYICRSLRSDRDAAMPMRLSLVDWRASSTHSAGYEG